MLEAKSLFTFTDWAQKPPDIQPGQDMNPVHS